MYVCVDRCACLGPRRLELGIPRPLAHMLPVWYDAPRGQVRLVLLFGLVKGARVCERVGGYGRVRVRVCMYRCVSLGLCDWASAGGLGGKQTSTSTN